MYWRKEYGKKDKAIGDYSTGNCNDNYYMYFKGNLFGGKKKHSKCNKYENVRVFGNTKRETKTIEFKNQQ